MSLHWNTFHYTASALELLMPSVCLNRVIGISLELIQPKLLLNASFCFKCLSASRLISPWNVIKFFNHSIKCTQFDNYNPRFVLTNAVITCHNATVLLISSCKCNDTVVKHCKVIYIRDIVSWIFMITIQPIWWINFAKT